MKKNILKVLSLFVAMASLSSCLKDDSLVLDPAKSNNVIEFKNPATISDVGGGYPLYQISFDLVQTATLPITISWSGAETAVKQDVNVKFEVATQAEIDAYNDEHDTGYTLMSPSVYTLSATEVTIPKGQKTATFDINLKPLAFNLSVQYVLPLKIVSASSGTVSGNYGLILLNIGAKNKYDGIYKFKSGASSTLQPNKETSDAELETTGEFSVRTNLLQTYSNLITYTFDPATDKVVRVVDSGLGAARSIDPASGYNAATKTIYLKYFIGTRTFEETYTYVGSR